jgi:hypothetical protein
MSNIKTWNNSNITTGNNSWISNIHWNKNKLKSGDFSKKTTYKENAWWFFSGIVLPVISGLIVEYMKQGSISELLWKLINLFK